MNSLAKKILIKPNTRWLFYNAPDGYLLTLSPLPDGVETSFAAEANFDGVQLFVVNNTDLVADLPVIAPLLKPETIFWICYPKKSSGVKTDLAMMASWNETEKYGIEPVAAASIDDTWTGLRFRFKGLAKTTGVSNAEIKQNEFSEYIDVENRQIKMPPVMASALEKHPTALAFYQQLAYTNKKEYVMWILTAKQEKTKEERLIKLVEKLSAKKKNPSEK